MQPTRNPNFLYNKVISATVELLNAIQADEEPDRDEILLLQFFIKALTNEKAEQNTKFQQKTKLDNTLIGGVTPWQ